MPEVDFTRAEVRRNPYAERLAREGIESIHREPSTASLAEMPEVDFAVARVRRNPYAARAAEAIGRLQYGKGRPVEGQEVGPTSTRSLRLPESVWNALDIEARHRATTVHALLRVAITRFLGDLGITTARPSSRPRRTS